MHSFSVHSFSEESLDDGAVELTSNDPTLIFSLAEEYRQSIDTANAITGEIDYFNITGSSVSKEYSCATHDHQTFTHLAQPTLFFNILTLFDFYGLDAYDSGPPPSRLILPRLLEMTAYQLSHYDLSNLNGQKCLQ